MVHILVESQHFRKEIKLRKRMDIIREEMMMKCMHPSRLERWLELDGDCDDF
jgi:hypothetical protein